MYYIQYTFPEISALSADQFYTGKGQNCEEGLQYQKSKSNHPHFKLATSKAQARVPSNRGKKYKNRRSCFKRLNWFRVRFRQRVLLSDD